MPKSGADSHKHVTYSVAKRVAAVAARSAAFDKPKVQWSKACLCSGCKNTSNSAKLVDHLHMVLCVTHANGPGTMKAKRVFSSCFLAAMYSVDLVTGHNSYIATKAGAGLISRPEGPLWQLQSSSRDLIDACHVFWLFS